MEKKMSKLLTESIIQQVREVFGQIQNPVHFLFFGKKESCDYCDDTRKLIEEVTAISEKLSMSAYDLDADADVAKNYSVDKAPGLVIAAKDGEQITDYGIRFVGIPSGHEFSSLIQGILLVAGRDSGLNVQTREFIKDLDKPVHLQVFVTPT